MHVAQRFKGFLETYRRPDRNWWTGQKLDVATGGVVARSYFVNLRKGRYLMRWRPLCSRATGSGLREHESNPRLLVPREACCRQTIPAGSGRCCRGAGSRGMPPLSLGGTP